MKVRLAILFTLVLAAVSVVAQSDFKVPALTGPVVDETGQLSASTKQSIEAALRSEVARGGPQIQVLILNSLQGLPVEEASIKVVEKWKLGSAKKDDGVLLLIAPNERKLRIEVGQGVEGNLPDVIASRIIREVMTPRLRAGDFEGAVRNGVGAILKYSRDQTLDLPAEPPQERRMKRSSSGFEKWIWIILILFFLIGGGGRRRRSGLGGFLLGAALGGMGRGGRGGFGGGGGWSGGGGGFSGGGASGSW